MAIHAPITGAPSRASSNIVRLPTAAKRPQRTHSLTAAQLADRGIRRILPFDSEPLRQTITFDPTNPLHVRAWNNLVAFGQREGC